MTEQTETFSLTLDVMDKNIEHLYMLKKRYEEAKKISTEAYHDFEEQEARVLAMLDQSGKKSYRVDGLCTVTKSSKLSVQTPKTSEDRKAFFDWISMTYGEDAIWAYASVNSQTLNKMYNECMEEAINRGEEFKMGGVDLPTERVSLSIRSV